MALPQQAVVVVTRVRLEQQEAAEAAEALVQVTVLGPRGLEHQDKETVAELEPQVVATLPAQVAEAVVLEQAELIHQVVTVVKAALVLTLILLGLLQRPPVTADIMLAVVARPLL
jgi:hypothetical protein